MTLDVYRGRKTTIQQQQLKPYVKIFHSLDMSLVLRRYLPLSVTLQQAYIALMLFFS